MPISSGHLFNHKSDWFQVNIWQDLFNDVTLLCEKEHKQKMAEL